ncbi:MAG TPA: 4Fe-4S binding protein, partial [Flavobacteriaceae bacterium]|nr:4Fe-4S binding protein [Flavobacteriaceae bacterium]
MGNNRNRINNKRRKFFQTSAALLGGAFAASVMKPVELLAQSNEKDSKDDKNDLPLWGMGVDVEKCIGCGKCVEACKLENNV